MPRSPSRRLGPLLQFWRGHVPVAVALLGVLLGGRIVVTLIWRQLTAPLPWPLFALIISADAAVLLWQIRGSWRSIARALERGADRLAILTAQIFLVIVALVALIGFVDHLAGQSPRRPWSEPAAEPLPVSGGVVILAGPIDFLSLRRFEATPPGFTTLRLESEGGLVYAARALAQRVAAAGIATEVLGDCLSACTLVFVAADRRSIGPDARLGFHGYIENGPVQLLDIPAQEARDRAFLASQGITAAFLDQVAQTPPSGMWFPDRETLRAAGVLP